MKIIKILKNMKISVEINSNPLNYYRSEAKTPTNNLYLYNIQRNLQENHLKSCINVEVL